MRTIDLDYGMNKITMSYDPDRFEILRPELLRNSLNDDDLLMRLKNPLQSRPLDTLAGDAESALIIISDPTRITRADVLLPLVLKELDRGGMDRDKIDVLIARGNHRPVSKDEIDCIAGPGLARSLRIHQHDSTDESCLVDRGSTSRGTKIALNRLLFERDLVIVLTGVSAHYFAGFGGGRKSIFPGIAGRDSIIHNHTLSIDFIAGRLADGVEPCRLDGNPVHEDIMECVSVRPPDFVVNTLLTSDLGIGELFAGDWKAGHKAACESYLRFHGAPISERRNLVVASCGGSPKDIDMIQSHKSIQYCCRALLPGGALILLAECTDGYGSPNFEGFFPIHKIESHLDAVRSNKRPNGQTALALHQRATEHTVYFISRLPEDVVQDMGLIPRKSLEGAVAAATEAGFGSGRAYIIPAGADTIPFLR